MKKEQKWRERVCVYIQGRGAWIVARNKVIFQFLLFLFVFFLIYLLLFVVHSLSHFHISSSKHFLQFLMITSDIICIQERGIVVNLRSFFQLLILLIFCHFYRVISRLLRLKNYDDDDASCLQTNVCRSHFFSYSIHSLTISTKCLWILKISQCTCKQLASQ